MAVSSKISRRIRILSLLAMVSVVIKHSAPTLPFTEPVDLFFRSLLTTSWTNWAVPYFFIVSGFFFANSSDSGYGLQVRKKIKTLLLPYIMWAIIGFLIMTPLNMLNNIMTGKPVIEHTVFGLQGLMSVWSAFGIVANPIRGMDGLLGPACNGPLWYVRALLLLFLFSPLFVWLKRILPNALAITALGIVLFIPYYVIPWITLPCSAIGYFLIGMTYRNFIFCLRMPDSINMLCGLLTAACAFVNAAMISDYVKIPIVFCNIPRLFPLLMIVFAYHIVKRIEEKIPIDKIPLGWPFWTYCFHGTIISCIAVGCMILGGKSRMALYIIMLSVPVITLLLSFLAFKIMNTYFPKTLAFLCGGRV